MVFVRLNSVNYGSSEILVKAEVWAGEYKLKITRNWNSGSVYGHMKIMNIVSNSFFEMNILFEKLTLAHLLKLRRATKPLSAR